MDHLAYLDRSIATFDRDTPTNDYQRGHLDALKVARAELATLPIAMLLFCPRCGCQHVDAPSEGWENPPHRSHQCQHCDCIWRPADVSTTGVLLVETSSKADNWTQAEHDCGFADGEPYLCELCSKPILHGHFVNQWDDIGTAHANCEAPLTKPTEPTLATNDDGNDVQLTSYVMLGTPMLLVVASLQSTTLERTP